MDFPQQVEETLVEKPTLYDITMEPILEGKTTMKCDDTTILVSTFKQLNGNSNGNINDYKNNMMSSSVISALDDTTPSDSGVQLLDSESSELMIESITSQNGFEFDEKITPITTSINGQTGLLISSTSTSSSTNQLPDLVLRSGEQHETLSSSSSLLTKSKILTQSDFENSNIIDQQQQLQQQQQQQKPPDVANTNADDVMTTSNCSTFDTENIVYRRRVKKQHNTTTKQAPKKRVSFHEDILKNTRTDNIHIEHGFITYKNGRKNHPSNLIGRYSWCSEGDNDGKLNSHKNSNNDNNSDGRQIVYRNACSDVLDYGNADIYENLDENYLKYDNSGIFEYYPQQKQQKQKQKIEKTIHHNENYQNANNEKKLLYKCSCSSSNSSLDSGSDDNSGSGSGSGSDKNSNHHYEQSKSSSCDCIGMNNTNNNFINENCYFSEPSINENTKFRKSVWSKEKKPKSSCLKKTKRHTDIIQEHDLSMKMKKFNVHDMNHIIDNSKMIFGSLKSIFTIPLPERGVPEGSEDVQSVYECIPECDSDHNNTIAKTTITTTTTTTATTTTKTMTSSTSPIKPRPFLSKSLDGGLKNNNNNQNGSGRKKFIHNVDEQLRRKNEEDLYAPTRQNSDDEKTIQENENTKENEYNKEKDDVIQNEKKQQKTEISGIVSDIHHFRNKFIVNCESTVFEHTGVSYTYNDSSSTTEEINEEAEQVSISEKPTPLAEIAPTKSTFISTPIKQTFANILKTLTSPTSNIDSSSSSSFSQLALSKKNEDSFFDKVMTERKIAKENTSINIESTIPNYNKTKPSSSSILTNDKNSICSDCTTSTTSANNCDTISSDISWQKIFAPTTTVRSSPSRNNYFLQMQNNNRHLPSPMKKRSGSGSYGNGMIITTRCERNRMSPDLFNLCGNNGIINATNGGRESKNSTILSEEFDDILTITTDTDKNESDIVIVDYPENIPPEKSITGASVIIPAVTTTDTTINGMNLLKPPKSSLINRFLRNVTQKKILESSIRKNNFFTQKIKSENKLFGGNLYLKGVKPKNPELIEDLNAEIAMEIEMSGINSPRRELTVGCIDGSIGSDLAQFELGIGEISIEIFNGNSLHILKDANETLMKVFKLYTGYSREGYMTPVLVFLTDRTLYVTDLVRNRLCNKFVLPYSELDVILMGPYGNTVLLCNGTRDMQQVLLAGGPYPANGLVANLEFCARRSGSILPAVGQLTLEHLAPLQAFVRENSSVSNTDSWIYYAVINVPAGALGSEQEPLGPHIKGFLMHRRISENGATKDNYWHAGYFLLKAGVLYMFNDSTQKLPTWAMALAECQGARRAVKTGRPHCFEILLKHEMLQLAAPDEYVASEWLQALVQAASGLFEMQEKHKTLGCTLVMTENHLITLREDFRAPLRRINKYREDNSIIEKYSPIKENIDPNYVEISSTLSSAVSTPTKTNRSNSSINSTPTKMSQLSRSTITTTTGGGIIGYGIPSSIYCPTPPINNDNNDENNSTDKSYTNMSSFYGKNAGVEVLTCAAIKEMIAIRIPSHNDSWWCILEFSCQEVRENSDDLVIFFASSSEMQRFLRMLEQLWQAKNNDLFPVTILDEDDIVSEQCTKLYMDINRAWEPLLSAALGYPQ